MKFIFQSILWPRENIPKDTNFIISYFYHLFTKLTYLYLYYKKNWVRFVMFNSAFEVMTNYFEFLQLDR